MPRSLVERLNQLKDKTPDQIVAELTDPLACFIKIKDITEELWNQIEYRDVVWYNYRTQIFLDREFGAPLNCPDEWGLDEDEVIDFDRFLEDVARNWSVIGFEHQHNDVVLPVYEEDEDD